MFIILKDLADKLKKNDKNFIRCINNIKYKVSQKEFLDILFNIILEKKTKIMFENTYFFQYIINLPEKIQLEILTKYPKSILYINKPTEKIKKLVAKESIKKFIPVLSFPDYEKAFEEKSLFESNFLWNPETRLLKKEKFKKENYLDKDVRKYFYLYAYEPWNKILPMFADYLEKNVPDEFINELYQNALRDDRDVYGNQRKIKIIQDKKRLKAYIAENNLSTFIPEYIDFLKFLGFNLKEVSKEEYNQRTTFGIEDFIKRKFYVQK